MDGFYCRGILWNTKGYDRGFEYLTPHFKNVVKEFEEKYGNKVV